MRGRWVRQSDIVHLGLLDVKLLGGRTPLVSMVETLRFYISNFRHTGAPTSTLQSGPRVMSEMRKYDRGTRSLY